jgi:hypothetical protein
MPFTFQCPQCQKTLSAREENAGKKVRCPGCSTLFPVPSPPRAAPKPAPPKPTARPKPPPEQPEGGNPFDFEAPRRPAASGRTRREYDWDRLNDTADRPPLEHEWREVGRGLDMVRLGLNFFLGEFGLGTVATLSTLMAVMTRSPGVLLVVGLFQILAILLGLTGFVLVGIGAFRCAAIPESSGVKGLALAAAICSVIPVANFVGWILFLIVLRSMATHLRDKRLGMKILAYLICLACSPVVVCLFGFGGAVVAAASESLEMQALLPIGLPGILYVVFLILTVWFSSLVGELRNKISRSPIADRRYRRDEEHDEYEED